MRNGMIASLLLTIIFFIVSFVTLGDYGISWDETLHFRRGQAYLYYFLTGQTNYNQLSQVNLQGTEGNPKNIPAPRRSFYQNDYHNGEFWLNYDSGHPPFNDISAAFLNYIFFQKLGVLDDISAHHLFNIFTSSLLVFVVVYFALSTLGKFASVISFLTLVTYPIFWAEAHFNIKDPPEAAFFAGCIWAFYESLKKGNTLWLILSIIFFSLALGTKFNVLFLPFIIIPYLLIRYRDRFKSITKVFAKIPQPYILTFITAPVIAGSFLMIFWPFLRQDVGRNLPKIIGYYRHIGSGTSYQPLDYYLLGFNTFPLQWIVFTTPPLVLLLFGVGVYAAVKNQGIKNYIGLLWLFWFIVPVLRVSLPNMSIYGGIRQILEFLPALALISGLGAWKIIKWVKHKNILMVAYTQIFIVLLFIWPAIVLIKMHPNENVYFNFLIGGLSGAKERNFPSWGNSLGNAYKQGIVWINNNAEEGAKVTLIQGTPANAPLIFFRPDINYSNKNFSAANQQGEYIMELTFNDTAHAAKVSWEYVNNFLEPVYQLKVDNVAILKIWKNDIEYKKQIQVQ